MRLLASMRLTHAAEHKLVSIIRTGKPVPHQLRQQPVELWWLALAVHRKMQSKRCLSNWHPSNQNLRQEVVGMPSCSLICSNVSESA